jgi:hypothetical protein
MRRFGRQFSHALGLAASTIRSRPSVTSTRMAPIIASSRLNGVRRSTKLRAWNQLDAVQVAAALRIRSQENRPAYLRGGRHDLRAIAGRARQLSACRDAARRRTSTSASAAARTLWTSTSLQLTHQHHAGPRQRNRTSDDDIKRALTQCVRPNGVSLTHVARPRLPASRHAHPLRRCRHRPFSVAPKATACSSGPWSKSVARPDVASLHKSSLGAWSIEITPARIDGISRRTRTQAAVVDAPPTTRPATVMTSTPDCGG